MKSRIQNLCNLKQATEYTPSNKATTQHTYTQKIKKEIYN